MKRLNTIEIHGRPGARIELCQGDVAKLDADQSVDALVVSAFPNDYTPRRGTVIGSLHVAGVSVAALAIHKDFDIRPTHSCWLSEPFDLAARGLRFGRVLCFEPEVRGRPPERVGDIFRALEWIVAVRPEIRSVALPIVAAGDAGYSVPEMLEPMLDAAVHWLELGLGLDRVVIVAHSDASAEAAARVFEAARGAYTAPALPAAPPADFDLFISYSHANTQIADALVGILRELRPGVRVFVDRHELDVGMAWQEAIFEGLERSRRVVALLSPAYLASKACKEEFGIARLHGSRIGVKVLLPVYVLSADLPAHMAYVQYLDAREGDEARLREAAAGILSALDAVIAPGD